MPDVIQFVDAMSANPGVLLDMNDDVALRTRLIAAPPPRLRRTTVQNAMSDGEYVSSSTYGGRLLTLDVDVITSTQDQNAALLQKVARLIDRPESFIRYQPAGHSRPGFLRTTRADIAELVNVISTLAFRQLRVELPADPFMLGLRQTISVGTVNNDPAAGSNGCYFDVTNVRGDVAAPMVMVDTGTIKPNVILAVTQGTNAADFPVVFQGESMNFEDADTANPGGAADAAMSGSGSTNYARTSFATSTSLSTLRLTALAGSNAAARALRGTHRALLTVRRTEAASTIAVRTYQVVNDTIVEGDTLTVPLTTNRQIVDLGMFTFGLGQAISPDMVPGTSLTFQASRSGGAGSLQWDCLQYIPADYATCVLSGLSSGFTGGADLVFDGEHEQVVSVTTGTSIFSGGTAEGRLAPFSGSIPKLKPGVTNRFTYLKWDAAAQLVDKAVTGSVTLYYQPRYLYVPTQSS